MVSSVPISPFAQPSAPPPPVILLLDSTELYIEPAALLLAFEDLQPGNSLDASPDLPITPGARGSLDVLPDLPIASSARYHPYSGRRTSHTPPSPRFTSHLPTMRDATPQLTPRRNSPAPANCAFTSPLSSPTPSPRSSPPPSNNEPRHVSFAPVSNKIRVQRPKGAGRKNLQSQVKWEDTFLANVKKLARALVKKHLDDALCFKDQDETKLLIVKTEMVSKFPRLDDYENMWPLDILIMGLLKYSSSHGKGISTRKTIDGVRNAIERTASSASRARLSRMA